MGKRKGRVNETIVGVLLVALGLFLLAALLPGELTGTIGAGARRMLAGAFGWASFFVPAALVVSGWVFVRSRPWTFLARRLALLAVFGVLTEAALGLASGENAAGGHAGLALGHLLVSNLGPLGAWLFLAAAVAVFALGVRGEMILESRALAALGPAGKKVGDAAGAGLGALWQAVRSAFARPFSRENDETAAERKKKPAESKKSETAKAGRPEKPERPADQPPRQPVIHGPPEPPPEARKPKPAPKENGSKETASPEALVTGNLFEKSTGEDAAALEIPVVPGAPVPLPPVSLLIGAEGPQPAVSHEELRRSAQTLTEKLADFDVLGQVGEIHPGPVITRFEFEPAPGIKVAQVTSRTDDLAMALKASRIRIVAPIPGKAAIGVEIPNSEPAVIYLKDVVATDTFLNSPHQLTLALGKDIGGAPFYAALEKMPHLLIAGTTGSGKSVCINSIITSLLFRLSPDRLRMIFIDPKMLELTMYNDVPHLLTPVITEAREAARALHWLTGEMERRYRQFAERGVRNIQSYHERFGEKEAVPYIVVVVDELADLMLTDAGEIEAPIARLAQMARAVGIHLVLATQRPSVDVLTGVIKANFPARIAFQVASRVDSRTILDMNGAESLIGRGDMLFLPPGAPEPHRVHGAFVSDKETEKIVSFLGRFRSSVPRIDIVAEAAGPNGGAAGEDPLFEDAARIVITHQQGSVSLLQRRLKVGYSRAARLMDMLEAAGIVGPPDGSKAREVLADASALEQDWGREGR